MGFSFLQHLDQKHILGVLFGSVLICLGLYYARVRHRNQKMKTSYARKFGLSQAQVDVRFRPIEGTAFKAFNIWIGLAFALIGVGFFWGMPEKMLEANIGGLLMIFGMLQIFIAAGLSYVFTGRAQYYYKRLVWEKFAFFSNTPKSFDVPDSIWTTLKILWLRLFGALMVSIILWLIFMVAANSGLDFKAIS